LGSYRSLIVVVFTGFVGYVQGFGVFNLITGADRNYAKMSMIELGF
jgi:hypothetical protein